MSKWKDGLPPVGTHCECTWGWKGLWLECIYHGKMKNGVPIVEGFGGGLLEFESALENIEFRPLKSEAERKRDEAVEALALQVSYCYEPEIEPLDATPYVRMAEKLHDAGYRKITPLTDAQIDDCTCCDLALYDSRSLAAGAKWARSHILGEES